jgi:hypothetical protein
MGTATPAAELDVSGSAAVSGSLTVASDLTVATNTFVVDVSNGRVGVGIGSPAVELDVSGAVRANELIFTSQTITATSGYRKNGAFVDCWGIATVDTSGVAAVVYATEFPAPSFTFNAPPIVSVTYEMSAGEASLDNDNIIYTCAIKTTAATGFTAVSRIYDTIGLTATVGSGLIHWRASGTTTP